MKKPSRNQVRLHRKKRIRSKMVGTVDFPRFSVFRSLKDIKIQVIDDLAGKTLVAASLKDAGAGNTIEGARRLGVAVAGKCLEKKIEKIVFDRSGYKYHGKIKAVAEGAREGGLKF